MIDDTINIGTALKLADEIKPPPIATCPRDGAPLIATFVWRGAEFYCLDCGDLYGFLSPRPADPTPELEKRMKEYKAEWDANAGSRLLMGSRLANATDEQRKADEQARQWLRERVLP